MLRNPDGICERRYRIALAIVVLWISGWSVPGSAQAEDPAGFGREVPKSERVAILEMLAKAMRSNAELIKTWRGTYEFIDIQYSGGSNPSLRENDKPANVPYEQAYQPVTLPDETIEPLRLKEDKRTGYWFLYEGKIDFVFDRQSQREYVRMLYVPRTDFLDVATSATFRRNSRNAAQYKIYSSDSITGFDTGKRVGPVPGHAIVDGVPAGRLITVLPPQDASRRSGDFDCQQFFDHGHVGSFKDGSRYWSQLERYANILNGKVATATRSAEAIRLVWDDLIKVYVKGDSEQIYTVVYGDPVKHQNLMQFDAKWGFNLVLRAELEAGALLSSRTATFRRFEEAFLPEKYEERYCQNEDTPGQLTRTRTLKLVSASLNEPVSDADFSVNQFDLKYCDRLLNEIKGELHLYDDIAREFVPAEKFSYDATRPVEK